MASVGGNALCPGRDHARSRRLSAPGSVNFKEQSRHYRVAERLAKLGLPGPEPQLGTFRPNHVIDVGLSAVPTALQN